VIAGWFTLPGSLDVEFTEDETSPTIVTLATTPPITRLPIVPKMVPTM
jgi:hypothetical protein